MRFAEVVQISAFLSGFSLSSASARTTSNLVESKMESQSLPTLIVVTGRPGAGKTTLAHRLAPAVPCPLVSRDEIKEGLQIADPSLREGEAQRGAYEAFFANLDLLLRRSATVVAEAAFQHGLWAEPLTRLMAFAQVRIVVCEIPLHLSLERRAERMRTDPRREHFHPDPTLKAMAEGRSAPMDGYDAPHLDVPTLRVDTSDGYRPSFEAILSFVQGSELES